MDIPITPDLEARARRLAIVDLSQRLLGLSPLDPSAAVVADWPTAPPQAVRPTSRAEYVAIQPDALVPAWMRYVEAVAADEALAQAAASGG